MSTTGQKTLIKKRRLGEILLERGRITEEQLQKALTVQKEEHGYLGDKLISLGFLDEQDIVVALVVQCHFPYIAVDDYLVDQSIIQLIPMDVAHHHMVVPLDRVGDVLSLVMVDPFNTAAIEEIERLTHCRVAPFIATKTQIQKALEQFYSKQ